jgi:hypothetical protein
MRPDIRRAALRAAAKTALVVSFGCSSSPPRPPPSNTVPADGTAARPAATSCAEYLAGLATGTREELAAGDPLHDRTDVFQVFTDVTARRSPRTRECCTEALEHDGAQAKPRWACCSALPDNAQPPACTPWGPPCPPAMA